MFISIAGSTPKRFDGCDLPELVPKKWWWKIHHDSFEDNLENAESVAWYTEKYQVMVLTELDPSDVVKKIVKFGYHRNITLLCYETPDKFCHKQMVAERLNQTEEILAHPILEWRNNKKI